MPTASVHTSALTDKDRADLAAGISMGVDLVAVSFVQCAQDLVDVRQAAEALGATTCSCSSRHREKPQAVERIEEILDVSERLMVARGDLGV